MTTRPTPSVDEQYVVSAENYERYFVPSIGLPVARHLLAAARPTQGQRVLDVACGTGTAARLAAEAVGPTGAVVGLDVNPGMLEVARSLGPDDVDWHEASADEMPLPDSAFDLVLCSMGVQFFPDRAAALREMRRVLAPNGRVVWCTPGPTPPLFEAIDEALREHLGPGASMFVRTVFSLYDADEAAALMRSAGFGSVDIQTSSILLHVPPPAEFVRQYIRSTPLAVATAEFDERKWAALDAEVVERCAPFVDGDTSVMEPGLLIVSGRSER